MHINKCPILAPAKTLTAENAEKIGIDREQCLKNLTRLRQHPEIREKLVSLYAMDSDFKGSDDVDSQLYSGFFTPADRAAMDIILETPAENLPALQLTYADPRIQPLLFRYRARNYPHTLSDSEQRQWATHCRDYFESRLPDYMLNLENLAHEHENEQEKMAILKSIYRYVEKLVS